MDKFPLDKTQLATLLMRRDNLNRADAQAIITDFQDTVDDALDSGNYHDLDDLIMDELGLEPDYLILFI